MSRGKQNFPKIVALVVGAIFCGSAFANGDWRILNADWDNYYPKDNYGDPGVCMDTAIEAWHVRWGGHRDAIFTLTEVTATVYSVVITNNAGGGISCVKLKPDESGNEDILPPKPPSDNPPASPPDTPPNPPEDTPPDPNPGSCTRNPIVPAKAEKIRNELDWIDGGPSPLSFVRYYSSKTNTDRGIGKGWNHNWGASLSLYPATGPVGAIIKLPSGDEHVYRKLNGATSWTTANGLDQLTQNPNQTWTWRRANDDSLWIFSSTGLLISSSNRTGWTTTYTYSANGLLTGVTNPFGRQITLGYNAQNQLTSVQTPDGRILSYGYDTSRRLTSVTYPDNKQRQFVYEHALFPNALTGIIDENNKRWGTFAYDALGRAVSSELAGGVSRYEVGYPAAQQSTIKDPLGITRSYSYSTAGGSSQVASSSAASGPGTSVIANRTINAQGLVTQSTDFKGNKSTTSWDLSRFLQTDYTEAFGTSQQRSTTYTWHSNLRLPVGISRTGRSTIFTYDTQGRPMSRTIVDTTVTPNTNRTSSWTYNAQGLVATATAANGAVTQYTYDSAGNVATMTNALGHVTTYSWDSGNRLASVTYPNGRVVSYAWDSRDRLLALSNAGYSKTMTYLPSGQVHTVTDSAGYAVTYQYDDAHRMTGWSDNRGNSGVYTLDAMGNRTQEAVRNAQGQTAWRVARTINSLNRAASVTVGGQTSTYGYDANGDATSVTDGQGQSESQNLDALRRVASITNAENATASLTYNALDATTQASDFKGVATTYTRDALGNATSESSPDTGTETTQYDALGLPTSVTDALGQTTTTQRDQLGRPTLVTYADGRSTTLRYDLTSTSKGYLSEIVDASGTTTYQRDAHGRVTTKTQTLINGDTRSVSYGYNAQGLLASTTYPGGQVLQYVYDSTGQVTDITWAGQPLVSGIMWNPLGQPIVWSWNLPGSATPISAARSYNTAGQLTATEFSSYQYDAAGRIHTLSQNLWQPASTNPLDSTIAQATSTWTVQYSPAGRIIGFTKNTATNTPADSASFQYDANGNRTASTRNAAGTTTSRTYSGSASHNRLLGFAQTTAQGTNTATSNVTYQYNNAGDLLGDGLISYQYDSEGRMESATTGQGADAPQTKYAHNGLGQRVFKTEPLYSSAAAKPASTKTLANLLADDDEGGQTQQLGFIEQLKAFFSKLWSPATSDAEKLGWSYVYGEDGTLLGEYGSGGANSAGTAQYLYLPTASGPMPIAAVIKGQTYAVHSDHLNTPRKLTQADGQAAWQWEYSAFGDEPPTTAAKRFTSETTTPTTGSTSVPEVTFNLRYPGQYFDAETKLHYNYFRSYDSRTGRYTQGDPIGLDGGWNRFGYVEGSPLSAIDPNGLQITIVVPGGKRPIVDPEFPPGVGPNQGPTTSDSELQQLIEKEANRREYKNACDQKPPSGLNDCERAKWELKKWTSCKALREANTNKWWGGQDTQHNAQMMTDIEINISNAERTIKRVCKEKCP